MPFRRQLQIGLSILAGTIVFAAEPSTGETWWSFRELKRPAVPKLNQGAPRNPIDAFLREKLEKLGLTTSPEADRGVLIRRLYFDLIGLPPRMEEVDAFVHDESPQAYERLVDRLLDSLAYGERWARHWLDVVHYGDTHGYDKDQPRPNAWPYRDYVIRAFNGDKPYSRFVQEQIAGDVLYPNTRDGIEALGFISAGPWDLIGHAEVPETKTDGKIARHLDRDDMVANTMNTFNSLTVQCAQCHNHKFDPIPTEDYYSLQAVFAAVDRTNREYYEDPALNQQRDTLRGQERSLMARRTALQEQIERSAGPELADLRKKIEAGSKANKYPEEHGYHSAIASDPETAKWVQVDLGATFKTEEVAVIPCWDDFAGIGAGFGFPVRFRVEISNDERFETGVQLIHEQRIDRGNPGMNEQVFRSHGRQGRYVRITATKLAKRQDDYILALAEVEVRDATGKNVARGAKVSALDSIEAPIRWSKQNLTDGIYPGTAGAGAGGDISELQKRTEEILAQSVSSNLRTDWDETTNSVAQIQAAIAGMPKPHIAFVGAVHYGTGAFRGTGAEGGKPRAIHILPRGDVRKPGKEVTPGALTAVAGLKARFDSDCEGDRRKALALWLTDPGNPLTWRSIVNRVWQYHFGRGIVETPNDFGHMGAPPSHPALLDWLAVEFRDGGQSFKKLHKLIVTSAAYRQVSWVTPENRHAAELDQDNRLLWRMNRRKLEAEAVRDSVLAVSGRLDRAMFGPGFQDFVVEKPEHSPHYQYDLFDPEERKAQRRSIYRFIVRSQQQPFMTTLDCADPSMLVDKRNESLSALQALALLNNGFMLTMARHFAETVAGQEPNVEGQVRVAFESALARRPTASEQQELVHFAQHNGMPNTCRLLFNLNEFNFVD